MDSTHLPEKVKSKILYLLKLDERLRHWDDARYLKLIYRLRTGKFLDLVDPRSFSQKLQWLKINDRQSIYNVMVDKYEAKKWAADRIGKSHIVPNLGVWDSFDQIDFDDLPQQFVLKCTHDSGGLVICKDRDSLDMNHARAKIERSLSRNYYYLGREWPYRDVKPRILAEVYLPTWKLGEVEPPAEATRPELTEGSTASDPSVASQGIIDYKFYCFHGEPMFLYVSQGLHDHGTARMDFLTLDWELTNFRRPDYRRFSALPPKPANFNTMISMARNLSAEIPFVRVDFFEHLGRVLFSEMTFSPVSGMMRLYPKSADFQIGQLLDLSSVGNTR